MQGVAGRRPCHSQTEWQVVEREILQLLKENRLLWKAWRRAEDEEKEGFQNLWKQIRTRLTDLGSGNAKAVRKKQGQTSSETHSSMPGACWRRKKSQGSCRQLSRSKRDTSKTSSVIARGRFPLDLQVMYLSHLSLLLSLTTLPQMA